MSIDKFEDVSIVRIDTDGRTEQDDIVIKEHALTITLSDGKFVKDRAYVTIFCSPTDLEYLGLGFLLSDDIISSIDDVESINLSEDGSILDIHVKEKANLPEKLLTKRDVTSGCGRNSTPRDLLEASKIQKVESDIMVSSDTIIRFSSEFQSMSDLYKSTGGTHASALCDKDNILIFKEDIGRHNAVDKVFGECLSKGIQTEDKMILTSGRISSEMLIKSAKRHIPIVVSRSAPTSMALEFAKKANITLVGFARGRRMNIYSHDYRIE
ncbi:TPA: formate dehydrogenase accessory sulfurtransferase FdhD [bacterium]|nr:formate dehydrogenase accessory sulfurtransferase FdhD [bacterium]